MATLIDRIRRLAGRLLCRVGLHRWVLSPPSVGWIEPYCCARCGCLRRWSR